MTDEARDDPGDAPAAPAVAGRVPRRQRRMAAGERAVHGRSGSSVTGGAAGATATPDIADTQAAVVALVLVGDDLTQWWASLFSLVGSGAAVVLLSTVARDVLLDGRALDIEVRNWT